jgi:hypothetical protein
MITMINDRGVDMKRVIALLAVAALIITILSPPVAAISPDPNKRLLWMDPSVSPNGDDSGWHEADSEGRDGIVVILDLFKLYGSRYFVIYPVPNKIDNSGPIERDVNTNNADIPTGRGASPR